MAEPTNALNRRQFLRLAIGSTGALIALEAMPAWSYGGSRAGHWAFFSDTHIKPQDDGSHPPKGHCYYNPHAHLQRAVREALAAKPEGLVIAGDLARLKGEPGDYKKVKEFLAPLEGKIPVFTAMGNHDDRDHFASVFSCPLIEKQPVSYKYVLAINTGAVRLLIMDSSMTVNQVSGKLGEDQLAWLREFLHQFGDKPVILCFHHDLPKEGREGFADAPELLELVRPLTAVKALVYGHSHRYHYGEMDGIHLINLPALGYSFGARQPVGWVEAKLTETGGAFTLRGIDGPMNENGKTHRLKWRS